ncbi:hypothetical protein [Rubrivivax gelatinosus]|uniref:Transcriptional regulator n=1 Tax=Rubrivivax gelatinosus TaxID=28068 RepID=A0ABS1DMN7_RUBGE|nr:hypothetical protein [Rubrivivax gelatinosus]MBK1711268.1 hypothetical protein [Rubrivivax gelatinosus]
MQTSAFASIAKALTRRQCHREGLRQRFDEASDGTRTAMLLDMLDRNGAMPSRDLADAAGLSVKAVRNLLDGPRQRDQVRFLADLAVWEINRNYDEDLHAQLLAAAALLRRHGWTVEKGERHG